MSGWQHNPNIPQTMISGRRNTVRRYPRHGVRMAHSPNIPPDIMSELQHSPNIPQTMMSDRRNTVRRDPRPGVRMAHSLNIPQTMMSEWRNTFRTHQTCCPSGTIQSEDTQDMVSGWQHSPGIPQTWCSSGNTVRRYPRHDVYTKGATRCEYTPDMMYEWSLGPEITRTWFPSGKTVRTYLRHDAVRPLCIQYLFTNRPVILIWVLNRDWLVAHLSLSLVIYNGTVLLWHFKATQYHIVPPLQLEVRFVSFHYWSLTLHRYPAVFTRKWAIAERRLTLFSRNIFLCVSNSAK